MAVNATMEHRTPALNVWPGKRVVRRCWLDAVIDELDCAQEICLAHAMPGLAARIAQASAQARTLRLDV